MKSVFFYLFFSLQIFSIVLVTSCSTSKIQKPTSKPATESKLPTNGICLSGDCWNGKGTFEYANKDRYIGEFREGLPNGEGLMIFQNGSSISGSFKNGKVHGFATEYDSNRRLIYSGEWLEGKKQNGL